MSGSTLDTLIVMANQIGDFFETMRDRNKSLDEIAGHLRRSWDPRMRIALMNHVEQHGGEGLKPIVLEAVRSHKMI
jgi:formate dehydrogenase subunit delta